MVVSHPGSSPMINEKRIWRSGNVRSFNRLFILYGGFLIVCYRHNSNLITKLLNAKFDSTLTIHWMILLTNDRMLNGLVGLNDCGTEKNGCRYVNLFIVHAASK